MKCMLIIFDKQTKQRQFYSLFSLWIGLLKTKNIARDQTNMDKWFAKIIMLCTKTTFIQMFGLFFACSFIYRPNQVGYCSQKWNQVIHMGVIQ